MQLQMVILNCDKAILMAKNQAVPPYYGWKNRFYTGWKPWVRNLLWKSAVRSPSKGEQL